MKKSTTIGIIIFSIVTLSIGSVYSGNKVFISWDVRTRAEAGYDEFSPNKLVKAVKLNILKQACLSPCSANEYDIYNAGSGPMDPPTLLDETLTLEENGISDGDILIIKPN